MGDPTEVVLFRWHSGGGSVFESVAKAVSVADFEALDVLVKARWGAGVVTVKSYVYDERIDWDTQVVCHDDRACGYTSRPFPSPPPEKKTMTDPTAADMERARERAEQFMSRVVLEWDKEPLENWKVLVDEHVWVVAHALLFAIECRCAAIAQALADARAKPEYVRPEPPRYDEVYFRGIAELFGDES